jgi:hypothetical protein
VETSRAASAAASGKDRQAGNDRQTGNDRQAGRENQESPSNSTADRPPEHRGFRPRIESDSHRTHNKIEASHERHSRREKFLANRLIRFQNSGASVAADEAQAEKNQQSNKSDRVNGSDNTRRINGSDNLSGQVGQNPEDNRYFPGIDLVIAAVLSATAIAKSKNTESAASQLDQAPKPVPQAENIQNKFDNRQAQAAQDKESKEKESKEEKRREQSKRDETSVVDATTDAAQMPSDMPAGYRRGNDPDADRLAAQSEIAAQLASKIADSADDLLPGLAFGEVDDSEATGVNEDDRSQKISKFFTKMASQTVREVHQIVKGDTLNSLAEQRFNNRNVAALFARVNRGRIKEYTVDNQKVVELSLGQTIEIPTEAEVERYLRSELGRADGSIMTIITEGVSSRTVNKALSKLV